MLHSHVSVILNHGILYSAFTLGYLGAESARICRWRGCQGLIYYIEFMANESFPGAEVGFDFKLPGDERAHAAPGLTDPEDQAAFTHLFTEYFAPLYRFVYGHVPMAEEAKDIVHMVFYRIWTGRAVLDPDRPPLPFLCTLARFAAIDYLRHQRVENRFARRCLRLMELEGPPEAPDNPERELLNQELSEVVSEALDELSPRQREVMALRWREQLSYEEIATRLNVSRKTVAIHLARAMEHLRGLLPGMYDID